MSNGQPIEARVGTLEHEFIRHETSFEERWKELDRSRTRTGERLGDHNTRLQDLEAFKNNLAGKLALSGALGAVIGSALIGLVAKLLA